MNNEQKYASMNYTNESACQELTVYEKKSHKKNFFFKKIVALSLSAVILGGIAGGTFWGVNFLLDNTTSIQNSISTGTSTSSLTNVSYTTGQSLDVTSIAAQGLSSVVSVTNI